MTQIEDWKDGNRTNVQQLFIKMKEQFKCDYLVVLGCKVGQDEWKITNARIEMLRVVEEMEIYSNDVNLQAWGMCKIHGLKTSCELKEWKEKCELICCAVINGMKKHGESNVDVAKNGCGALNHLAFNNAANKKIIVVFGFLNQINQ